MSRRFNLDDAKGQGEKLAADEGNISFPVDLLAIASKREIIIEAITDAEPGVSAMLLRDGNTFGIFYSTAIPSLGFQRFSIAHELGHYFLDGHVDQIPFDEGMHASKAGTFCRDVFEQEADSFASGLLMPSRLFRRALNGFEDGLAGVKGLAGLCQASLTATAIRYAELTEAASAVVVSTGKTVDFACMSSAMKSFAKLTWLRRGDLLPKGTLTANFNAQRDQFDEAERSDETDLRLWLDGTRSRDVVEEIIGLGRYGKTLTVLTCPDADGDGEDEEEEDSLRESWTPRF
ncbi:MAG: ImmA/IrrE family metallo-endopeptidase [Humidesulfovibrio sp.]|uniref:ImmA/IrrE family metallo-endopeptidase n=1 Tax=Humidesulfovibrio sp. TaxID=2910988 RepID=UPI0027325868|nr:ImmA/IrrE family metallo-endopeptidase [Humidesulfovibrio sp.]MDP2846818.1 ImmA/IrrE family metallo-endopeptidase [Humidesulfovibrio sp.]